MLVAMVGLSPAFTIDVTGPNARVSTRTARDRWLVIFETSFDLGNLGRVRRAGNYELVLGVKCPA
jgi:hypothetical protein